MNVQRWSLRLAILATSTALSLSILAGWQRGGTVPERLVWVAIGLVLVISAHLLPALIQNASISTRLMGGLLWAACLAAACYGHAEFFVFAQIHAGEQRVSLVPVAPVAASTRSLTVVMQERAAVTAQLASVDARYCAGNCAIQAGRHATLTAKIAALDAEADDIHRRQVVTDQAVAHHDALLVDPVTSRLSALLGTTNARVDLLTSLAFAAVLEGVACVLWTVALRPSAPATPTGKPETEDSVVVATIATPADVSSDAEAHAGKTVSSNILPPDPVQPDAPNPPIPPVDPLSVTVDQLRRDVAAGLLRPTVADIRIHLACSQARALALRRELSKHDSTA
ncbi:hypothetical protein [Burkholderia sp. 22PA0106]|uniref:hypothetical protein n=1 Tax=Burkholderia sp. 22PA0106 TaxID=3237371 RepID=UPI0039C266F3